MRARGVSGAPPLVVPAETHLAMVRLLKKNLLACDICGIHYSPKHHIATHLAARVPFHGNPRAYSCWVGEGLNCTLRAVAERSHRYTFGVCIFQLLALQAQLGLNEYFHTG